MEIPKFHETFLPILKVVDRAGTISTSELKKRVRDEFYGDLPSELLEQTTKNGDVLILNRIGWGKMFLKQAGMIAQPERALIQISEKGRQVLKKGSLTLKEVVSDPDFLAHRGQARESREEVVDENASPQDLIDKGIKAIEAQVKDDLLAKLKTVDPFYFQRIVAKLLEKMGYGDPLETPKTGDGGKDGIINQDELGIDKIYLQTKRYADNKVRETEIRDFIGSMSDETDRGIFVTTSSFDEKAVQKANAAPQKIILIDGGRLVDLMYRHGIGVQVKGEPYYVKQLDEDFFEE
jgi:restriction system protein